MPSFVEFGPTVPERKIFDRFYHMDMAAILVMTPGLFTYTLIPSSYRCFISNLSLIGQTVSEKKIFEYYGDTRTCLLPRGGGRPAPGVQFFSES